jgi:hypothetical protein
LPSLTRYHSAVRAVGTRCGLEVVDDAGIVTVDEHLQASKNSSAT